MIEKELREYIEEYNSNVEALERINEDIKALNVKITALYGLNAGGGGSSFNSKVETFIMRRDELKRKQDLLQKKIVIVNIAIQVLNKHEREIIELVKIYKEKINLIAKCTGQKKKHVFDLREKSLKKMCEYLNNIVK